LSEDQKSYRQIFKATSLFGGVQVFQILISVIRSKFVAVLLGPGGMGIAGLLGQSTGFISSITNFGLGSSAVKNVAAASGSGDELRISKVITVLRKLVWITGFSGMIITAVLSRWLSRITFGNEDYTWAFIWISITLLFQQLSSGQMVILQGLRKLKSLATANVAGSVIGLLISIPIYYKWRLDGIVPVIIIVSLTGFLLSWHFARKTGIKSVKMTNPEFLSEGKDMLKMGLALSLNGIFLSAVSYIVRIYISNRGGIDQVGLYNAGFAIINTYVGMIFSAMATDYYPRLSAVSNDNVMSSNLVNQQAEIAILILAPLLVFFLIFINWIVILFYSNKFIAVNEMIHWAALGMYFKAASWSIAFIFLAKGASKLFLMNELIANTYILGLNILGYMVAGLKGLGISFLVGYLIYFFQVFIITNRKYAFFFSNVFYKVAGFQFILGLICFFIMRIFDTPYNYISGLIIILISVVFSMKELDKRIGLKEIIYHGVSTFKNKYF
jgi:O-antigen/teichoic acid export membrane protein